MAMRVVSKTGIDKPSMSESQLVLHLSPQHNGEKRLFRMLLPGCLVDLGYAIEVGVGEGQQDDQYCIGVLIVEHRQNAFLMHQPVFRHRGPPTNREGVWQVARAVETS